MQGRQLRVTSQRHFLGRGFFKLPEELAAIHFRKYEHYGLPELQKPKYEQFSPGLSPKPQ